MGIVSGPFRAYSIRIVTCCCETSWTRFRANVSACDADYANHDLCAKRVWCFTILGNTGGIPRMFTFIIKYEFVCHTTICQFVARLIVCANIVSAEIIRKRHIITLLLSRDVTINSIVYEHWDIREWCPHMWPEMQMQHNRMHVSKVVDFYVPPLLPVCRLLVASRAVHTTSLNIDSINQKCDAAAR